MLSKGILWSTIAFICISFILSMTAFQRTGIYRDDFSLWQDAVKRSPFKARPHNNLGRAYEKKEMTDQAMKEYLEAISLNQRYMPSRSNLAGIYYKKAMLDDAERELKAAIKMSQTPFEDLYRRLGFVYIRKGLADEGVKELEKAKTLIPNHPDAKRTIAGIYTNEGWSYTDKGDFSRALILHNFAFSIDPSYPDSHYGLALDYETMGQRESAIRHWREYLRLAPPDEPFRVDAMKHLRRLSRQ